LSLEQNARARRPIALAIAAPRSSRGFAVIFKRSVWLPKPEIDDTNIAAGFSQWSWREVGAE
jgi:hypothetical protein